MKIFAIDTSSRVLSLGMMSDGVVIAEFIQNKALTHSERLMPNIKNMFDGVEEKLSDIDLFATTVGPGSFTGIRIGVATANAFALANEKKVVGISTLEALANNFRCGVVVSTMYAQRDDYYRAIYSFDKKTNAMKIITHEQAISKSEILEEIKRLSEEKEVIVCGEILESILQEKHELPKNVSLARPCDNYVRGGVLCEIAEKRVLDGKDIAVPIYIRKPQAEVQYEEKIKAEVLCSDE